MIIPVIKVCVNTISHLNPVYNELGGFDEFSVKWNFFPPINTLYTYYEFRLYRKHFSNIQPEFSGHVIKEAARSIMTFDRKLTFSLIRMVGWTHNLTGWTVKYYFKSLKCDIQYIYVEFQFLYFDEQWVLSSTWFFIK